MRSYVIPGLLLLGILIFSGCTNNTPGSGLVITKWQSDFPIVKSNQPVILYLDLENKGPAVAKNVDVKISGISSAQSLACSFPSIVSGKKVPCIFGLNNDLKAPDVSAGFREDYKLKAVATYSYSTSTTKSFTVVTLDQLRQIKQNGGSIPIPSESPSEGPVIGSVKIENDNDEIYIFDKNLEFPISLEISNVGGGSACYKNCEADNFHIVEYRIEPIGKINVECSQQKGKVYILKPNKVKCKIKVNTEDISRVALKVDLNYVYQIEAETTLTVDNK